jgi:hypothetical protein
MADRLCTCSSITSCTAFSSSESVPRSECTSSITRTRADTAAVHLPITQVSSHKRIGGSAPYVCLAALMASAMSSSEAAAASATHSSAQIHTDRRIASVQQPKFSTSPRNSKQCGALHARSAPARLEAHTSQTVLVAMPGRACALCLGLGLRDSAPWSTGPIRASSCATLSAHCLLPGCSQCVSYCIPGVTTMIDHG